jgi:hypothetical protein
MQPMGITLKAFVLFLYCSIIKLYDAALPFYFMFIKRQSQKEILSDKTTTVGKLQWVPFAITLTPHFFIC